MRISREAIIRSALDGLSVNLARFRRAQDEVSSGRKVLRSSDEPLATGTALQLDSRIRLAERYLRAGAMATTRMAAEGALLASTADLASQAQDLGGSVDANSTADERANALATLRAIRQQVISAGNTRVGGEYILAGTRGDQPPFAADGRYVGGDRPREIELAESIRVPMNHLGSDALGPTLVALDRLTAAVEAGDAVGADAALKDLASARTQLQRAAGEVGSWQRQVEELDVRLTRDAATLVDQKEELLSADPTESLVRMNESRLALDRAYASVSKILESSLLKFLR
jgi:flagellar hook-associated protein 3 FlgL